MTSSPDIDIHDLQSVRAAAGVGRVVGDDYLASGNADQAEMRERRERRNALRLNRSPIARKIITFNLLALMLLVAGLLFMNPSRDNLTQQRAQSMIVEAELIADVFEAQLPEGAPVNLIAGDGVDVDRTLAGLDLRSSASLFVYDRSKTLVGEKAGPEFTAPSGSTFLTDGLDRIWHGVARIFGADTQAASNSSPSERAQALINTAALQTSLQARNDPTAGSYFAVTTPIEQGGALVGMVALLSDTAEVEHLLRKERERLLQLFLLGVAVSVGLSLMLASTIANPLSDLAAAAEIGRDRNARKMAPSRVRIPDLSGRPDEIGRLSGALRGMVAALYDRIEVNEQFAADVAHEIKNPLASLRSAVGTMRVAKKPEQQEKLLEVIEHDVQRLDRLVSDISNASRLDSELVKEEEQGFNLIKTLTNISEYMREQAKERGVEFVSDMPKEDIIIQGLEGRLAQVFVNLISNAISFCEDGDAIRVWVRRRDNRVIAVVEDTGPGIPEEALTKVFKRFYSERPVGQFGNNSGLGLAISKQIVEAHGGVIWAENIRPTAADVTSQPLGARFVVGLPI